LLVRRQGYFKSGEDLRTALSATAAANGTGAWVSPEHLAFTCTGTFDETQAFEGPSISMILLNDHAAQSITGTNAPVFASWAEAGAWKLAQDARASVS